MNKTLQLILLLLSITCYSCLKGNKESFPPIDKRTIPQTVKELWADFDPKAEPLDTLKPPRNNSWFLCTVAARRALTFLEEQAEVDSDKLGIYGHSMGGKLTVLTTGIDSRVKASAPSCGGITDRYNNDPLFQATLADNRYLENIRCPTFFLSPANDFHGRINDLPKALNEIQNENWRIASSAHHNHQDNAESQVAGLLWFDQHLKGTFTFPETPKTSLELKTVNGTPVFSLIPDDSKKILSIDIFYPPNLQHI